MPAEFVILHELSIPNYFLNYSFVTCPIPGYSTALQYVRAV